MCVDLPWWSCLQCRYSLQCRVVVIEQLFGASGVPVCMSLPSPLSLLNWTSAWAVYVVKDFLGVLRNFFSCFLFQLQGNSFSTTFWWIYRPWCSDPSFRSFHDLIPINTQTEIPWRTGGKPKCMLLALGPRPPSIWVAGNTEVFVDSVFCLVAGGMYCTLLHVTVWRKIQF